MAETFGSRLIIAEQVNELCESKTRSLFLRSGLNLQRNVQRLCSNIAFIITAWALERLKNS